MDVRNLVQQSTNSEKENGTVVEFTQDVDLLMINSYLQEKSSLFNRFKGIGYYKSLRSVLLEL